MKPFLLYCNDDELDMFNKTSYQTLHCSLKLTSPALSCAFQVKIYRLSIIIEITIEKLIHYNNFECCPTSLTTNHFHQCLQIEFLKSSRTDNSVTTQRHRLLNRKHCYCHLLCLYLFVALQPQKVCEPASQPVSNKVTY